MNGDNRVEQLPVTLYAWCPFYLLLNTWKYVRLDTHQLQSKNIISFLPCRVHVAAVRRGRVLPLQGRRHGPSVRPLRGEPLRQEGGVQGLPAVLHARPDGRRRAPGQAEPDPEAPERDLQQQDADRGRQFRERAAAGAERGQQAAGGHQAVCRRRGR